MNTKPAAAAARLRRPRPEDGARVWDFIRQAGTLDPNSTYCYILLCDLFRETCVLAEPETEDTDGVQTPVAGFLSAMIHPDRPDTLFVWQVGVAATHRRQGLGRRMLKELLSREVCKKVRYIEATIGPDNIASRSLFQRTAAELEAECKLSKGYPASIFPANAPHEDELLLRIGPVRQ